MIDYGTTPGSSVSSHAFHVITQDHSPQATRKLLAMLPPPFLETMVAGDLRKLDMVSRGKRGEHRAQFYPRNVDEISFVKVRSDNPSRR